MSNSTVTTGLVTLGSGAALLLATALYQRHLALTHQASKQDNDPSELEPPRKFGRSMCHTFSNGVFELREGTVREDYENDTEPIKTRHLLVPEAEAEEILRQNVKSTPVPRTGNAVVKLESAFLPGNAPMEDAFAVDVLPGDLAPLLDETTSDGFWVRWYKLRKVLYEGAELDQVKGGPGYADRVIMSVIDGHGGGPEVAELVFKTVHACIAYALAKHPEAAIQDVMSRAITALNRDMRNLPRTLIGDARPTHSDGVVPYPPPTMLALGKIMVRGACLHTALIDNTTKKLYVANLGDCRVVGGWYQPKTGSWRCEVMSKIGDHGAKNPLEEERLRAEHPADPDVAVCDAGTGKRLLGMCMLTRSMGDTRYQESEQETRDFANMAQVPTYPFKVPLASPPYMGEEPEMIVKDLAPASGERLRVLILAVDGFWDGLSIEEAALLMAAHTDQPVRGDVLKTDLAAQYPIENLPEDQKPYAGEQMPSYIAEESNGVWAFQDENAALHLLRNSLGHGDAWVRQRLLSLRGAGARQYRDDITVV